MSSSDHFQGKPPLEHLFQARKKGQLITQEIHGNAPSCSWSVFWETIKTFAVLFSLLFMSLQFYAPSQEKILLLFGLGSLIWAPLQRALLHWKTLYKLHRLIEEEKWEIDHHRNTEREELAAMYQAKGFSGKMLDQVVDVLMADDNRLLETMLTEEFGLSLESFEHPLKLGFSAFLGVFSLCVCMGIGVFLYPISLYLISFLFLIGASLICAKKENIPLIPTFFWNTGIFLLVHLVLYFSHTLFSSL